MSSIAATRELSNPFNPGVTPCGHRLVVWPLPVEKMSKGGIAIPHQLVEREDMAQMEAVVVAVGPSCWKDQPEESRPWCRVGDKVLIAKYGGFLRKGLDGRDYRLINDLDVVGVCDDG
jgi:co-chaperonin GroES (HSP10)